MSSSGKGVNLQVPAQNINTGDATGRLLFNTLGAIARFEPEIRAERQMDGIQKAKERGVVTKTPELFSRFETDHPIFTGIKGDIRVDKFKKIKLYVVTKCSYIFYLGSMFVKFEWDSIKNDTNIKRHGIDFTDVRKIFDGYILTIEDDRFDYGEHRFLSFGLMHGHVIVVVHTETAEKIRIISARKATKNEQKEYFKQIPYGSWKAWRNGE